MGNFFKDIGRAIEKTVKDPTSYFQPSSATGNFYLSASGNKTAGEAAMGLINGSDSDGGDSDTSDIESQAQSLADNPPQISIEDTINMQKELLALNRENALQASEDAARLADERTAQLTDIILENKMNVFKNVFGKDFSKFAQDMFADVEGTRDRLGEIAGYTGERLGGIFADVSGIAKEFMSGQLPQDVKDFISDTRAELNIGQGRFGEDALYATARDLGLTSLDMVGRGLSAAGQAANIAIQEASVLGQLSQGQLDVNRILTGLPDALLPSPDPTSIYGAESNRLAGAAIMNPSSTFGALGNMAQFNASTQFDAHLSNIGVGMDLYSTQVQQQMNKDAIKAQEKSNWFNLAGDIVGAGSAFLKG